MAIKGGRGAEWWVGAQRGGRVRISGREAGRRGGVPDKGRTWSPRGQPLGGRRRWRAVWNPDK
jgi:hypothetical protein